MRSSSIIVRAEIYYFLSDAENVKANTQDRDNRELKQPRLQRQPERRQTKGLEIRAMAMHVSKSLYISLPSSTQQ